MHTSTYVVYVRDDGYGPVSGGNYWPLRVDGTRHFGDAAVAKFSVTGLEAAALEAINLCEKNGRPLPHETRIAVRLAESDESGGIVLYDVKVGRTTVEKAR